MILDIVFFGIVGICWVLSQWLGGYIGVAWALPILSVLWFVFEKWLWRYVPPKVIRQYIICGEWSGKLYYEYKGKKGVKDLRLTIKQTFLRTDICIRSNEMVGKSIASKWRFDQDKLFYIYQTDPKTEFKDANPIQYGGAQIKITPEDMTAIRIEYWTDRGTKGYMELKKC